MVAVALARQVAGPEITDDFSISALENSSFWRLRFRRTDLPEWHAN